MKREYEHIDKILPYGELIRGFANQNLITKSDLNSSLKERGIFLANAEKENLVPCLTSILMSPNEFNSLSEKLNTKEDNEKKVSSRINFNSDAKLINSIPDFINPKDMFDGYSSLQILGVPSYTMVNNDPNNIVIDIEVERNDLNKSWFESKNTFKCSVNAVKTSGNELKIIKTVTSPETYEIARAYEKNLIKHFKEKSLVDESEELKKILFGDFINEYRIVFFIRLSSKLTSSHFDFKDIVDWEFKPDETSSLPEKIEWMSDKDALILKGKRIHNTFFFDDAEYHKYLKVWSIEVRLGFSYELYSGECTVNFGFPEYLTKGDKAEFEINISRFSINQNLDARDKKIARAKIFDLLESEKNKIYNNYMGFLKKGDE